MVGSLALERFRLEEHLGSGSFGSVHRAWDLRLQRSVAIKAIPTGPEARPRVLREAQAVARLSHPNIVALYELAEEGGVAYLVTELVEGRTLREALLDGDLSDREVAEIGADLCEALDHAHARGVIHRDLKPTNILISDIDGLAKLMDFGVASLGDAAGLTATGDVVGTLAYMSPEQADGESVGPAADVYSLCLVLYECFSGVNPNRRQSPAATVRAIGMGVRPLAQLRPDLPADLCAAIDAGLEPDPWLRIDIERLGPALERALPRLSERPFDATERSRGRSGAGLIGRSASRAAFLVAVPLLSLAALMHFEPGVERTLEPLVTAPDLVGLAFVWMAGALLLGFIAAPFRARAGHEAVSRRMSDGSAYAEPDLRTPPLSRSR